MIRTRLTSCVLACAVAGAAPAAASVLYAPTSPPSLISSNRCGSISLLSSLTFRVQATDCDGQTAERAEFAWGQGTLYNGQTFYVGWRSRLNLANPGSSDWRNIFQLKSHGAWTINYPLVIRADANTLRLISYNTSSTGTTRYSRALPLNTWFNVVLKVYESTSSSSGQITMWYNGAQVASFNTQTWGGEQSIHWGLYRTSRLSGVDTNDIYRVRVATTYAEADPGGGTSPTPTPAPTGSVQLFQNCSYGGWSASFGVGDYTLSDLQARGAVNDDASSIRIPSGRTVTLYRDNNFTGGSITLTGDDSCLTDNSFNDTVSSMRVR